MKIYDSSGALITSPDLRAGKLVPEELIIRHPAVEPQDEVGYYKVVASHPNGGKDMQWVVTSPKVEGREAYETRETIYHYIPYTDLEVENNLEKESQADVNARLQALVAQNLMLTDCILEMSEMLYATEI